MYYCQYNYDLISCNIIF